MEQTSPNQTKSERERLTHLTLMVEEADDLLKSSPNFRRIAETIDMVMAVDDEEIHDTKLSDLEVNRAGKVFLDLRAMLTDTRPFWGYKTKNSRYDRTAGSLTDLAQHWYVERMIDQKYRESVDYGLLGGTGYLHLVWDPHMGDEGDIDVIPEDPRDVLLFRPRTRSVASIQECEAVFIRRERTLQYIEERYGDTVAKKVKADKSGTDKTSATMKKFQSAMNSLLGEKSPFFEELFGSAPHAKMRGIPTVDVYTAYIKDRSVNKSDKPYEVGPFEDVYDDNPESLSYRQKIGRDPLPGSYIVDPGKPIYPRGRMVIFTRTAILVDKPNPWWFGHHLKFPIVKFTPDPMPTSMLGKGALWDILKLQRALNRCVRMIDNHIRRSDRPSLLTDKNQMGKTASKRATRAMRRGGAAIQYNPTTGKPPVPWLPPPLDQAVAPFIDFLREEIDQISGRADISQLTKLGQLPSSETIDKILESMTPTVRARSRAMEIPLREFAMMVAGSFMQYYTTARRLRILGPDGMVFEERDFAPGDIMPDYVHDADFDDQGAPTKAAMDRGPRPKEERVKEFLKFFAFEIAPSSLLDAASITQKLLYLQLARAGLVDHWTLLEKLGIPNVGDPPPDARTITERLIAEREMGAGMEASTVGRRPTGQAMPSMTPGGAISESG